MQKKGKRKKEKRKKNRIILRGCSRAAIDRSYGGRINFPYIEPLHSTSTGKTGGGGGGRGCSICRVTYIRRHSMLITL